MFRPCDACAMRQRWVVRQDPDGTEAVDVEALVVVDVPEVEGTPFVTAAEARALAAELVAAADRLDGWRAQA